jgi:integrase/recombinase XerD
MSSELAVMTPLASTPACREADTDERLVELWLHGRPATTRRVYRSDVNCFVVTVRKTLHAVTLGDLQSFADALEARGLKPATRSRMLATVKSLLGFAHRLGYVVFDVARPLRLPPLKGTLAERNLTEAEVQKMLVLERHPRNHGIVFLLYAAGMRVSECCRLRWRDLQARSEGGQVTIFGKGSKTTAVLLPPSVWHAITSLRGDAGEDAPVFRSRRRGGHLHPSQVLRVVKAAARRAGIDKAVSPHWMRHAHASHALDRGAPIHLVQATLNHVSLASTSKYVHARPTDSSSRYLGL